MRVLLGIHLPRLPLDVCAPPSEDGVGSAVLEQGVVLMADATARAGGVRPGMKRGGVLTLAPETRLVERGDLRVEQVQHAGQVRRLLHLGARQRVRGIG
ncbi:hypothetical protein PPH41_15460, partial [Burkholderia gladioli]|nr:hypothetical protein [Burkholderia gladioli]